MWKTNIAADELGLSLIRPGATCSGICVEVNRFLTEAEVLRYRSFGYGHSFGILSHYYGREAGLELREDVRRGPRNITGFPYGPEANIISEQLENLEISPSERAQKGVKKNVFP